MFDGRISFDGIATAKNFVVGSYFRTALKSRQNPRAKFLAVNGSIRWSCGICVFPHKCISYRAKSAVFRPEDFSLRHTKSATLRTGTSQFRRCRVVTLRGLRPSVRAARGPSRCPRRTPDTSAKATNIPIKRKALSTMYPMLSCFVGTYSDWVTLRLDNGLGPARARRNRDPAELPLQQPADRFA